jgi:acetyl/propionyl-CoA carboxylase alpha subunit
MPSDALMLRDEAGREHRIALSADGTVVVDGAEFTVEPAADGSLHVAGEVQSMAWTATSGDTRWVFFNGHVYTFEVERAGSRRRRASAHHGTLMAPMPATVRQITVATGDTVQRGDVLIVLEAMKMELPIRATSGGRVTDINCREGELVSPGVSLIEIEE